MALAAVLAAYSLLPFVAPGLFAVVVGPIAPEYARDQVPALAERALWDWSHRVGVAVLLILGALQVLRARRRGDWHRARGWAYAGLVALACAGGAWMLAVAPFDPGEVLPGLVFAALFAGFTVRGIVRVRRGDVAGHARDMRRSFALALGPLFVRVAYVPIWAVLGMDQRAAMGPSFWIGWGLPLLALEVWRRARMT